MRKSDILAFLLTALAVGGAPLGCALGDASEAETAHGTLRMPLRAAAPSGVEYHLSGTFDIQGPEASLVPADGDQTVLSLDLAAGSYTIALADWDLQNVATGLSAEAVLRSPNPQAFTITADQTTGVVFRFLVDGEIVEIGRGGLDVTIEVLLCEAKSDEIALCGGQVYACGDGIDNDGDGLVDTLDPHCLSACDNSESSLATNLPATPPSGCGRDCFWDANPGSGDDGCLWDLRCDPLTPGAPACQFNPNTNFMGTNCANAQQLQSAQCVNSCLPVTPNGCDCFGCCETARGTGQWVSLDSRNAGGTQTCTSAADFSNPNLCKACTPVLGCLNNCDSCEFCFDGTEPDPSCITSPPVNGCYSSDSNPTQCAGGAAACGLPGQEACPSGQYCVTGCCAPLQF